MNRLKICSDNSTAVYDVAVQDLTVWYFGLLDCVAQINVHL